MKNNDFGSLNRIRDFIVKEIAITPFHDRIKNVLVNFSADYAETENDVLEISYKVDDQYDYSTSLAISMCFANSILNELPISPRLRLKRVKNSGNDNTVFVSPKKCSIFMEVVEDPYAKDEYEYICSRNSNLDKSDKKDV